MSDVATLRAQLEKLKAIKYSGVQSTRHGDASATFVDPKAIDAAISEIERKLNGRGIRTIRVDTNPGW
jgi:hypothetical protein